MQHLKNHLVQYWIKFPPDPEAPNWKNVQGVLNWLIDEQLLNDASHETVYWLQQELKEFQDRGKRSPELSEHQSEEQAPLGSNPFMTDFEEGG